jgi:hypothetical protein
MPGEGRIALARGAGQTVVAAAITDIWESASQKVARLVGRSDSVQTETAERWLAETHDQLAAAQGEDLEQVQAVQAQRWAVRFADLLGEDDGVEAELRAMVEEIQAALPADAVAAADRAVATEEGM